MKSKQEKNKKAKAKKTAQGTNDGAATKLDDLYKVAFELHQKNSYAEAEKCYKELLALEPNDAPKYAPKYALVLADLGTLYIQTNRLNEAELYLKKSLSVNPNQAFALNNLATIYNHANKPDEANLYYTKAIEIDPNYADAFNNLGLNQYKLHQFKNAIPFFKRAVEINPHYFDAHYQLALCLVATHDFYEAEQSFNKAMALKPTFAELNLNLALMKLLQGNFEQGLPLYEWRWHCNKITAANLSNKPLWLGAESIAGKTVLVHPEQGYGDYIQFCRYALDLEKMGANVILLIPSALQPLIKSLSDKFTYITDNQSLQAFDFQCPIASLPLVFSTRLGTIPSYPHYLRAPASKKQFWQNKLGKKTLLRIGITWSGSAAYENDWKRSLPVHFLTTILRMDAEFHCLQKETKPRDWQILAVNQVKTKLINHEADLHDFSDTAALIEEMDLVISVDTAIAHLTGALGKPLWLLIPYLPDFRWLLDRDDSPWYPSAQLFRQTELNSWKEAIAKLNKAFELWLKNPDALNSKPQITDAKTDTHTTTALASAVADNLPPNEQEKLKKAIELHHAGKADKAQVKYKQILAQYPNSTSANNMLGTLYLQGGKLNQAEELLKKILSLDSKNAFALCNLGVIYSDTNRKAEAVQLCEQAIAVNPNFTEAYNNLGSYLCQLEENERAAPYLKRAVELKPDYTDAHFNLGLVYYRIKQFALAESAFNTVIAQQPNHLGVYYNLGLLKLLLGDFRAGLPLYEHRWQDKQAKEHIRSFEQPIWLGKDNIKGKTILLHSEQGHGDFIQFCRYAFDIEKLGAKVVIEVNHMQYELATTLSDNFSYVIKGNSLPAFDYHAPLLSLPLAFNTLLETIPAYVPYLKTPADKTLLWQNKLGKKTLPRVGIVWSGTTGHLNDHNRSIALKCLGSLFNNNIAFHVLQKDIRASDMGALKLLQAFNNVHIHQFDLHNFTDTAALIDEMDLVISVDTSVAHLAGAMGKPVWVLLSFIPDFRWLLDREDSPWYPSARLFRQNKQGNWASVIENVKSALEKFFLYLPNNANTNTITGISTSHLTKLALPTPPQNNLRQQIDNALSLHASGKLDAALQQFLSIVKVAPDNTEALTILATIYMQLNNFADSQLHFEKSLSLDNKNTLTLHNYGLLLEKLNRYDEAVKFIDAAIAIYPQYEDAYHNKIVLLKKMGKADFVIDVLQEATRHIKQSQRLYFQLHQHLQTAEHFDEALVAIDQFILLKGDLVEGYNNRGNTLLSLKQIKEALASYKQALSINPKYTLALCNAGNAYLMLNQINEALATYKQVLLIDTKHAHALCNVGNVYLLLNEPLKALASCDAALAIEPNLLAALNNRASALKQLKRFDEALQEYDKIIAIDNNLHYAHFNKSVVCLLIGDFKAGWPLYESRWQAVPDKPIIKEFFSKPMWQGIEPLANKNILLHTEQGFGDVMQFCRYVYLVLKLNPRQIYITSPKALHSLLVGSFALQPKARNVTVITDGDALPQFDYQCPIMSLPLAFNTQLNNIPADVPYLFANQSIVKKWQSKLKNTQKKPKIGLVWSGSTVHINDNNRSITLNMLADILALSAEFHCLQIEIRAEDKLTFDKLNIHNQNLHNHSADLTDFAQTAALANAMDLVISVDTSVAHLAGAMGKPVWILLPYMPDYRWLLDRDDSPWYPTARLFRQSVQGEWGDVIERLKQALIKEFKLA